MLKKILPKFQLKHNNFQSIQTFGGGDIRHKFIGEIKDEKYRKYDFIFQGKPQQEKKVISFYNFMASFPLFKNKQFLKFFTKNFDSSVAEVKSDFYHPPRIHENGIFVYHSREMATIIRQIRGFESFIIPGVFLFFEYPLYAAGFFVPTYFLFLNASFYEFSRRLVTRLDLLPHLESVSVQRVGAFGHTFNKLYRVRDLEHITPEKASLENLFWLTSGVYFDKDLVFKCKATNDYLLFDRDGFWDNEGLNHTLLN